MNRRSAWVRGIAWIVVVLSISLYLKSSLKVESDIAQFMPNNNQHPKLRALESEIEHGPAATVLLLNIHGGNANEDVQLSQALRSHVPTGKGAISYVQNGDASFNQGLFTQLEPYAYLLTDTDWSIHGLRRALLARVADLRSGAGPIIGEYMLSDPYLSLFRYLKTELGAGGPKIRDGVWFNNTTGALLLVKVDGESLNLDVMQRAIHTLKKTFYQLRPARGISLEIAGPGAMAVATRAEIKHTIQQLSWVVTVMMLLVFWLAYRSLHLLLLASVPLISAMLMGMGMTQLIFGEVHGIVIAFGMTLLGMCIDYPLHLFSHCRHDESALSTVKRIWPTLSLGGISSALAFLVLIGSGFSGLSQLAVFAASGVMAALVVTRWLLPYWVKPSWIHPRYLQTKQNFPLRWQVAVVLLVLLLPLAAWHKSLPLWTNSIASISPVPKSARNLDGRLRKALGAANVSHVFVVRAKTREGVLVKTEKLTKNLRPLLQNKLISRIISVTQILPSQALQRERQQRIPTRGVLVSRLATAVRDTPFRANAFAPFLAGAEKSRTGHLLEPQVLKGTALAAFINQGLIHTGSGWMSLVRIAGVKSDEALDNWLQVHPALAAYHVQTRKAVSELLSSYRHAATERVVLAFILLFLLVGIAVRRGIRMLRIILPVMLSVLASLSLSLLAGHSLTIFHMLAALLVMGMGLDYSLFFNRKQGLKGEHLHSMHAIGISMVTTVITFGVLALSSIPVMSAMGMVVAVGILLCFFLAWILAGSEYAESEKLCLPE